MAQETCPHQTVDRGNLEHRPPSALLDLRRSLLLFVIVRIHVGSYESELSRILRSRCISLVQLDTTTTTTTTTTTAIIIVIVIVIVIVNVSSNGVVVRVLCVVDNEPIELIDAQDLVSILIDHAKDITAQLQIKPHAHLIIATATATATTSRLLAPRRSRQTVGGSLPDHRLSQLREQAGGELLRKTPLF